jgi:hypothetical protein
VIAVIKYKMSIFAIFILDPLAGSSNIEDEYWSRYVEIVPAVKEGKVDEEDSIPCENCGSLFPISCLELHEVLI